MEQITALFLEWGIIGLIIAAFTESFCSPILPDFVLIPLALAEPRNAISYGMLTTVVSVAGGLIGYWIGNRLGIPAARRIIPHKYMELVQKYVKTNATWAIFLAALSPIPYKFVSIFAGALRVNMTVFIVASFLGRAKRFLFEGILIYYYGPTALAIFNRYSDDFIMVLAIAAGVVITAVAAKRLRKKPAVLD